MKIKHVKKTYVKTASGKNWSQAKKNIEVEKRYITLDFYKNYTSKDNIEFFNDRVERSYQKIGYVPTKLTRISPDGQAKIIDHFIIED